MSYYGFLEDHIREPLVRKNVHISLKQFYDINRFSIKLHLKEFCAGGKK